MKRTPEAQRIYALALRYYPDLWPLERLETLVRAQKLSQEDMDAIIWESDKNQRRKGAAK